MVDVNYFKTLITVLDSGRKYLCLNVQQKYLKLYLSNPTRLVLKYTVDVLDLSINCSHLKFVQLIKPFIQICINF